MKILRVILITFAVALAAVPAMAGPKQTEATRAVAHGFLRLMFVKNDVRAAYDTYAAEDFIQHNPKMADGLKGHRAYFDSLGRQPAKWAHVFDMILVQDDKFAVLHHVFTSPEDRGRVFVDIWRVKGGKIVEHWDIIQDIPAVMKHTNGMGCGRGNDYQSALALGDTFRHPTCGWPDRRTTAARTIAVIDKYLADVRTRDVEGAIHRWFSADYRQHSPTIEDGADGAIRYLNREWGQKSKELPKLGPVRLIAEGDLVMYHRLVTYPGATRPSSNIDIYRVTRSKVSEHWDVKQLTPETSANANGMW